MITDLITQINLCSAAELNELSKAISKARRKFPTQPKVKVEKPVDPDKEFRLICFRSCKDWFYKDQNFTDYEWSAGASTGLNRIINSIIFKFNANHCPQPTQLQVLNFFQKFFTERPEFFRNKIDFPLLASKFDSICREIKEKSDNEKRKSVTNAIGFNPNNTAATALIQSMHDNAKKRRT